MHTGRSTAAGRAMIGLDTGFFLRFLENDPTAVQTWRDIVGGEEAVVSSLTLFELKRLSLKGMVDAPAFEVMNDAIAAVCKIQWIDNTDVLMAGAGISHGLGIPAMDSLILAGFLAHGADTILTTDAHLARYKKKGVRVLKL